MPLSTMTLTFTYYLYSTYMFFNQCLQESHRALDLNYNQIFYPDLSMNFYLLKVLRQKYNIFCQLILIQ